ncbi:MAG: S41 family peptidase [Candidatus Uhrbacteria bacterium]|nr:S41 family peptidase [Candidatus Uhrbacteria bacterium]
MLYESKANKKRLSIALVMAAVALAVAVFYVGFLVGNVKGAKSLVPEGESRVVNVGFVPDFLSDDIDFAGFWEVWDLVKDVYVDQPVSEQQMYYGALEGLLGSLGDPYSVFFDPELTEEFTQELNGTFSGIGAEVGMRDDFIVVISPLAGSPAEESGLMPDDKILAIDGVDTFGMTLNEAVFMIRGEVGTDVTLTITRDGFSEAFDVAIKRAEIAVDSVTWEIRDDGIAVINIRMFNEDTTDLFQSAVQEILTSDVNGIVVDLRNNPGGLLSEAINVAGFWIDGNTVVIERLGGEDHSLAAAGNARLAGIDTAVLVNGGSASASEILAGAIQDYSAGVIIGEQTFGKGSVQEFYELPDGSAVKITVAEWLTPNGTSINEVGITPDMEVLYTEEDYEAGNTPQLDAAIDYLTSH